MMSWNEDLSDKINFRYFDERANDICNDFEGMIKVLNEENSKYKFKFEKTRELGELVSFEDHGKSMNIELVINTESIVLFLRRQYSKESNSTTLRPMKAVKFSFVKGERFGKFEEAKDLNCTDWQEINDYEVCKYSRDNKKILNIMLEELLKDWLAE